MAMDDEYGLDYGPAPGAGLPRVKDIRDWAKQANPNWEAATSPIPKPSVEPAKEVYAQPTLKDRGTTRDFIRDLVVNKNVPIADAFAILERRYQEGDPIIRNMQDVDEVISRLPSKLERFGQRAGLAFVKPIVGAAEKILEFSGMDPKDIPPAVENINQQEALTPKVFTGQGVLPAVGNIAPELVGSLPAWLLPAGAISGATSNVLLRLPRFAKAAEEINLAAQAARGGRAFTSLNIADTTSKALRNINRISGAVGNIGGSAITASLLHEDAKEMAKTAAMFSAAGFVGGAIWRFFKPDKLGPVVDYIAKKSGLPASTIAQRMKNFDEVYQYLNDSDASPQVKQAFFNAAPGAAWNKTIGDHFGRRSALDGLSSEELETVLKLLPTSQAAKAARGSFYKTLKELGQGPSGVKGKFEESLPGVASAADDVFFGRLAKTQAKKGGRLEDIVGTGNPTRHTLSSVRVLAHPAEDFGGAVAYRSPSSLTAEQQVAQGVAKVQSRTFLNPYHVAYDPSKETAAEAVIRTLSRPTAAGRVALYMLNRYPFTSAAEYAQTTKELAYRIAKSAGYDSIFAKGKSPNDRFFVDLLHYKGEGGLDAIADKLQKKIDANTSRYFEGYPSILLPAVLGGSAFGAALLTPDRSEAINFSPLKKAFAKAISGGKRFSEGFTEIVSPEGKSFRPPSIADFRSPEFNPTLGRIHGHDDIAVEMLGAEDKADLVKQGYLRTFRQDDSLGVQFDPAAEGSTKLALNWLAKNYRHGDSIIVDRGAEGGEFFLPGDAAKFIKGKMSKLALVAALTGVGYETLYPQPAEASMGESIGRPLWRWLSKGFKGLKNVDEYISATGAAQSSEELAAIQNIYRQKAAAGIPGNLNKADALFSASIAPTKTLSKDVLDLFGLSGNRDEALRLGSDILRLPAYAIEHPMWDELYSQSVIKQEALLTGKESVAAKLKKTAYDVLHGIPAEQYDELEEVVQGLVMDSKTGKYIQTLTKPISPEFNKAARFIKEEVDDQAFRLNSGIHPQAKAILKEFGLEENEDTWRTLKYLQSQDLSQGIPKVGNRAATAAELGAAIRTKGMLNFEPWHDLNTQNLTSSILTRYPLAGEKGILLQEVKRLSELYPNGVPQHEQGILDAIKTRLAEIDALEYKVATRKSANLNMLPRRHSWGPMSESHAANIPSMTRNKNAAEVLHKYIDQALSQAFFNEQLYFFRGGSTIFDALGQTHAAEYARRYINTLRGMRSMNEDNLWASRVNRINKMLGRTKRDPSTVESVRNFSNRLLELNFIGKLGLNPAYPIVNMSQPILTGAPVTGTLNMIKAFGKMITNPMAILKEAGEVGVLRTSSQLAEEVGKLRAVGKVVDFLPNYSENFNRALVYQAGKLQALRKLNKRGLFVVPKYLKPHFDHSALEKSPEEVAKAYGAAVVRATQFMFGPAGRPLTWSGGATRRVAGQFKSFQASYFNLLWEAAKSDPKVAAKMIIALGLLGGANAVVGDYAGRKLLDVLRSGAVALGLDPNLVPEGSPIGKVFELFGVTPPLDFLREIDLKGAVTPQAIPFPVTNPEGFLNWAAGPTLSGAFQMGKSLAGYVQGKNTASEAFTGIVRPLAPATIGIAGLEALQEAGMTPEWLDQMNYRGGIYGPTGKRLVQNRSSAAILARGLNLQPSAASQRYRYKNAIRSALEVGDVDRAVNIVEEARARGFVIDKPFLASIKSSITKEKGKQRPNQR